MAHLALMSVPLHGHMNPMLGIAAELVARGHRVTFATGGDFAPLVEETGAVPLPHTTTFPSTAAPGRGWLPADDDGGQLAVEAFAREREAVLPQVAAHYADDRPDLVVHDTVTGHAPVLARAWGVPQVRFSPSQALPRGTTGPGVGAGRGALTEDVPCVVALPRSLQYAAESVGDEHVFVGPIAWRRPGQGTWTPPGDGRRVAFVSLGTTYNSRTEIFDWAAEAFTDLPGRPWHVVIATGRPETDAPPEARNGPPEARNDLAEARNGPPREGPTAPRVEMRAWVPQQTVLAHAEVFVTAGGTGSVLEALARNVPLVVLPQAHEQFVTAHQIATLGLGAAVPPDAVGPETLRAAVRRVTGDPGIGERIAAVREEIDRSGGAPRAADTIEARLHRSLPRTSAPGTAAPASPGPGPNPSPSTGSEARR